MKIKLLVLGGMLGSLLFFSCKKEKKSELNCITNEVSYDSYLPLKKGNYWVYQYKTIDTIGNVLNTGSYYDTITFVKEELINGKNYFKSEHSRPNGLRPPFPSFLREFKGQVLAPKKDSTGNYIAEESIIFSLDIDTLRKLDCNNFVPFTNCELRYSSYNLPGTATVTLPAGTFSTKVVQDKHLFQLGWAYWGNERTVDHNYAKDIGLVKTEIFYLSSSQTIIWELIDYHLE